MVMASSMIAFNFGLLLSLIVENVFGVALMGLVGGISIGGLLLARKLMIADVIDEDELITGVRREGVYMGIGASVSKISSVTVGVSMSLLLSSIIGYTPGENVPAFMDMGIRIGMVGFPTIFTVILLIFLYFYPLGNERVMEIREKIVEVDIQ